MTALLIVVGVAAYLTAYFAIGWRLAQRDLPNLWARARRRWDYDKIAVGEVHSGTVLTTLFWPIRLPFVMAATVADRFDPKVVEAKRREQEKRIAELERELEIKRRP